MEKTVALAVVIAIVALAAAYVLWAHRRLGRRKWPPNVRLAL